MSYRLNTYTSSFSSVLGHLPTQTQSGEASQAPLMSISEDNNLHYERDMRPIGKESVGLA